MKRLGENEGKAGKASKKQKTVLFVSIGIVVLLAGAYAGMHYTSRPGFCTSCHEIAPHVASWEMGPHKNVECLSCHAAPGNVGYIVRKVSSYKELYLHFTNQVPAELEWTPHTDACLYCHSGKDKAYPTVQNITLAPGSAPNAPTVSHQPMIDGKVNCISCHGNVGHAAKVSSS